MDETKYIVDDDNRIIDISTGEIIDKQNMKYALENKITQKYIEISQEILNLGLNIDLQLIKSHGEEYNCVRIKDKYTFGKVFRVSVRELLEKDRPSKNALAFIALLEPYIYFPTNSIIYHGKSPSLKELEDIVELKKSTLYSVLKELEEKDVIKKVKKNGNIIIYFNPFLYSSGAFILKDTYDLFASSKYNPYPRLNN